MADFDQHAFATQTFFSIFGAASIAASSMSAVGRAIDAQRLRDQDLIDAIVVRERSRIARRRAKAAIASINADAELRRAMVYVGLIEK